MNDTWHLVICLETYYFLKSNYHFQTETEQADLPTSFFQYFILFEKNLMQLISKIAN